MTGNSKRRGNPQSEALPLNGKCPGDCTPPVYTGASRQRLLPQPRAIPGDILKAEHMKST